MLVCEVSKNFKIYHDYIFISSVVTFYKYTLQEIRWINIKFANSKLQFF